MCAYNSTTMFIYSHNVLYCYRRLDPRISLCQTHEVVCSRTTPLLWSQRKRGLMCIALVKQQCGSPTAPQAAANASQARKCLLALESRCSPTSIQKDLCCLQALAIYPQRARHACTSIKRTSSLMKVDLGLCSELWNLNNFIHLSYCM